MSDPGAGPALEVEILTLFPEIFDSFLGTSLLGKAVASGIVAVHRSNLRDFAPGKHRSVDDTPYGGGPGMVLRADVVAAAIDGIETARGRCCRVLLSPAGTHLDQARVAALAACRRLLLICGRYEGIDERVAEMYADEVLSVGDYVLSGGEVAAMAVLEAAARLVPGVVGRHESTLDESFASGRLEYPHYTRPAEVRGAAVPQVLVSGDHAAVERWRRREALRRTLARRPDLFDKRPLSADERALLSEPDEP